VSTIGGIAIWLLACLYAGFFLMLYFNVRWINSWIQRIRFLRKFHRFFEILTRYNRKELTTVFLNSIARFVVFTSQYCILMLVIIPDIAFLPMLLLIFILFVVQAALPTLALFDFEIGRAHV